MPCWNEGLTGRERRKRLLNKSVEVPAQESLQDSRVNVHARPQRSFQGLPPRVRGSRGLGGSGQGSRRLRPLSFVSRSPSGRSRHSAPPIEAAEKGKWRHLETLRLRPAAGLPPIGRCVACGRFRLL